MCSCNDNTLLSASTCAIWSMSITTTGYSAQPIWNPLLVTYTPSARSFHHKKKYMWKDALFPTNADEASSLIKFCNLIDDIASGYFNTNTQKCITNNRILSLFYVSTGIGYGMKIREPILIDRFSMWFTFIFHQF